MNLLYIINKKNLLLVSDLFLKISRGLKFYEKKNPFVITNLVFLQYC